MSALQLTAGLNFGWKSRMITNGSVLNEGALSNFECGTQYMKQGRVLPLIQKSNLTCHSSKFKAVKARLDFVSVIKVFEIKLQ